MSRIVLLLIIGFLVYLAFRGILRNPTREGNPPARDAKGEDMVACARCGVNLPRSDARAEGGAFVCQDNPRCR